MQLLSSTMASSACLSGDIARPISALSRSRTLRSISSSDTGDVGKGLDIQISANGSYRKMNKDGKAWTARLSHVVYRMTPTTLEKPYLNPDWVEWLMGFPRKWTDIPFGPKNPPTSRV